MLHDSTKKLEENYFTMRELEDGDHHHHHGLSGLLS